MQQMKNNTNTTCRHIAFSQRCKYKYKYKYEKKYKTNKIYKDLKSNLPSQCFLPEVQIQIQIKGYKKIQIRPAVATLSPRYASLRLSVPFCDGEDCVHLNKWFLCF